MPISRHAQAVTRISHRYLIHQAARIAWSKAAVPKTAALADFTPRVVAAFGEAFYLPSGHRVAFVRLVQKLKKITQIFSRVPKLWQRFKKLVGIEDLTDIPGAISRLADMAVKGLRRILHKLFVTWPLKLYTLHKGKLFSFNDLLNKILSQSPSFKRWVDAGTAKIGDFGEMLRQKAPRVAGVLMVAIWIWIWLNVVEFEWDLKALTDAISGVMSFPDFLASLPGSVFGFLLTFFNIGTFTLFPYALGARLLYLLAQRYVNLEGQRLQMDWEHLREDFGIAAPDLVER